MSVSNISTASSNQPITPPYNPPVCGSAAAAAVAAVTLASPDSTFNNRFELLSDEVILEMLMNCSIKDIGRMRRVDTRLRDIGREVLEIKISDENIPLVELGLEGVKVLDYLNSLRPANLIRIKQLNLSRTRIDNSFLARLFHLTPNLQSLDLSYCYRITDDGLQHLAPFENLENLSLEGCFEINGFGLNYLTTLTKLRKLNLWLCEKITDRDLNFLAFFPELRCLNLGCCSRITDRALILLSQLPLKHLQHLILLRCHNITNWGFRHLALFSQLRILNIQGCDYITNEEKSFLKSFIPDLTISSGKLLQ